MKNKKSKMLILILLMLFIIVVIIYNKIPICDRSYKVDKQWFKKIYSLDNISSKTKSKYNTEDTSLEIKHSLMFSLNKYKLLIRDVYTGEIYYYGKYKPKIDVNIAPLDSTLKIILINKDNVAFPFGGKGGCGEFEDSGKDIIKKRNVEIILYPLLRKKCEGRYKMKIPLTKSEYKELMKHFD